ncbi:hypothetical protein RJ640_022103 [Escallonia rubra]|uniref:Retrovirus-related Pol polyprotein from transposon TNT 1-94 n=1 Tax=Escallonia rubra TaxID=112253 RepID=A0AA88UDT7_9ASTE|nr:hypothetical protein RJ640_022103 [Escallonia rubra]
MDNDKYKPRMSTKKAHQGWNEKQWTSIFSWPVTVIGLQGCQKVDCPPQCTCGCFIDWAGDTNDRHLTSGYCFNTGSAAVSWCSKKQDIVVLSSTEAEYVAATMATQECVWLKRLIGDMFCEVDYAVQIKCDNESAIKLASNPIFHARTKHIEVRYHFVREKVLNEEVELLSVRTNDQVADIFRKALVEPKFQRFRDALGVISLH